MRAQTTVLTVFVLLGLVVVPAAAGTAAAQPDAPDPTQQGNQSEEIEEEITGTEDTRRMQVDSKVWIKDWQYNDEDETFTIVFDAKVSTEVTITEMTAVNRGRAGQMSIRQVRVIPGGTEIEISAPRPRGDPAGVSITTAETIDRGYGVFLSSDQNEGLPQADLGLGVGVGIITMALGLAISVRQIKRTEHRRIEEGWQS